MMRLNPTSSSSLRHLSGSMATLLLSFVVLTTSSHAQFVPPCETFIPYSYDSGEILRNQPTPPTPGTSSSQQEVLIDTIPISHTFAPWIQLDLSSTTLAPNVQLYLEGTSSSTGTGITQILDANGLYADNGYSAVFDGDIVTMKLVYDPSYISTSTTSPVSTSSNTTKMNSIWNALRGGATKPPKKPVPPPPSMSSRVIISNIKVGICGDNDGEVVASTICGSTDDRKQSNDVRQGRMGGCTAWLISKNIFLRAGHCGEPNASTRIHFTSSSSNAPIADQYAVDLSTYKYLNGGVGKDWAIGRLLPNSSTGLLAGVAQSAKCSATSGSTCGWYKLGNIGSVSGNIRITGYGTAPDGRTQKTHLGALKTVSSTTLTYSTDSEGGNSGSPIFHEETGLAIGIHTHGGCSAKGGANTGTKIYGSSTLLGHINFLTKTCTKNSDCSDNVVCNGVEICHPEGVCTAGAPVYGNGCPSAPPTSAPTPKPTAKPTTAKPTTAKPT